MLQMHRRMYADYGLKVYWSVPEQEEYIDIISIIDYQIKKFSRFQNFSALYHSEISNVKSIGLRDTPICN